MNQRQQNSLWLKRKLRSFISWLSLFWLLRSVATVWKKCPLHTAYKNRFKTRFAYFFIALNFNGSSRCPHQPEFNFARNWIFFDFIVGWITLLLSLSFSGVKHLSWYAVNKTVKFCQGSVAPVNHVVMKYQSCKKVSTIHVFEFHAFAN